MAVRGFIPGQEFPFCAPCLSAKLLLISVCARVRALGKASKVVSKVTTLRVFVSDVAGVVHERFRATPGFHTSLFMLVASSRKPYVFSFLRRLPTFFYLLQFQFCLH